MVTAFQLAGIKVAYLGADDPNTESISGGTHSHRAALMAFGKSDESGASYIPCASFKDIFSCVQNRKAQFGVVPLINSTSGQVQSVFDLILKKPKVLDTIRILGSMMLHISHDLIGVGELSDIEVVYSKEEAIKQCRLGLKRVFGRDVKTESVNSTASGVLKSIADAREKKWSAGLASKEICSFYPDLKVLAEDVQDNPINETRFIIISNKSFELKTSGDRAWYTFKSSLDDQCLKRVLGKANKWGVNPIELHSVILDPFNIKMAYLLEVEGDSRSYKLKFFQDDVGAFSLRGIGCGLSTIEEWHKHFINSLEHEIKEKNNKIQLLFSLPDVVQKRLQSVVPDGQFELLEHNTVSSVESVWATLGIDGVNILKTMVYYDKKNTDRIIFCSTRGSDKIDYKKLNKLYHGDFKGAGDEVLNSIQQKCGAISPLTAPEGVKIIIDERVFDREKIFMGSGSAEISVILSTQYLLNMSGCEKLNIIK